MSGRRLRSLAGAAVRTGAVEQRWDGRDERGALVPPGVYIYRIQLEVDEGIEEGDRLMLSRLSSLINGQKVTYSIN